MTHTLHRTHHVPGGPDDIIVFSMAARGFNHEGGGPRLAEVFKVLLRHRPANAGDDNQGGVLTGLTAEKIIADANDKAYMAGAYADEADVEATLRELKARDIGMSVVVTGPRERIFALLERVGLAPHTVNLSIGTFGKTALLPEPEILDITSMCGHGMVCVDHVKHVIGRIGAGKMTAAQAAEELARPCTCAMFNPARAAHVLEAVCHRKGGESRAR
jgi:hypothetical protein